MNQLSQNLFHFQDTCNVYVLKNGDQAVLVDFGSGAVLDQIDLIGVRRVTAVLMTHHHRDQAQGLARAAEAGIGIWVPYCEQDLFGGVDRHWQAREVYNNYNVREDRFSLLDPVPVTGTLRDYAEYRFGVHTFTVTPTPGHTAGSLSLLAEIDGRRAAFTGDLIAAPGKVWSMAATQWTYNGAEGAAATVASLVDLKERATELILPSHGDPIREPGRAISELVDNLWALLQLRGSNRRLLSWIKQPYTCITPHLLQNVTSTANSYVLISESKKALLIDFGYDMMLGFPAGSARDSRRPWLYTLNTLKRDFGVERVDVMIPTHHHDDHVAGANLLRQVEGTRIWAAENFADVLERPSRYDLPCLWFDPVPVDRVLPLELPVHWEEYELTLYPLSGHTRNAAAIAFQADGRRVLAVGDQCEGDEGESLNYVYKSQYELGDYERTAALYRRLNPDLMLSGHWAPYWVKPGYFDHLEAKARELTRLHEQLMPLDRVDFGLEGSGARIFPYQVQAQAGQSVEVDVRVRNPFAHRATAVVRMVTPDGWAVDEGEKRVDLGPRAWGNVQFDILPHVRSFASRARIAADLTVDGRPFGQQAEALVTVRTE